MSRTRVLLLKAFVVATMGALALLTSPGDARAGSDTCTVCFAGTCGTSDASTTCWRDCGTHLVITCAEAYELSPCHQLNEAFAECGTLQ